MNWGLSSRVAKFGAADAVCQEASVVVGSNVALAAGDSSGGCVGTSQFDALAASGINLEIVGDAQGLLA